MENTREMTIRTTETGARYEVMNLNGWTPYRCLECGRILSTNKSIRTHQLTKTCMKKSAKKKLDMDWIKYVLGMDD